MQFDAPLKKLDYICETRFCVLLRWSVLAFAPQPDRIPCTAIVACRGKGESSSIKRRWRQFYAMNGTIQRAAWERTPREAAERVFLSERGKTLPSIRRFIYSAIRNIYYTNPHSLRFSPEKKPYATEFELSSNRKIFVWSGTNPSVLFLSIPREGLKLARPRDTYRGVIKIHIAFGYTEPTVLTLVTLGHNSRWDMSRALRNKTLQSSWWLVIVNYIS